MAKKKQETVADIVAEVRARAKAIRALSEAAGGSRDMDSYAALLDALADRIEAAHRRELFEAEASALEVAGQIEAARHKPVCNAAAMRDALARKTKKRLEQQERREYERLKKKYEGGEK